MPRQVIPLRSLALGKWRQASLMLLALGSFCTPQPDQRADTPVPPAVHQSSKRSIEDRLDEAESEIKKIWWEMRCKNDKVRDFMRDCEQQLVGGAGSQCVTENLEPTMVRMYDVPHVLVRLWATSAKPGAKHSPVSPHTSMSADGHVEIGGLRVTQLDEIFGPEKMATTSTVWVVYQPSSEARSDIDEAEKYARGLVRDHLLGKLHVATKTLRGPAPISCRSKSELLKKYAKQPRDLARPDEPQAAEPQHTIWVFRVDCPSSNDAREKTGTPQ